MWRSAVSALSGRRKWLVEVLPMYVNKMFCNEKFGNKMHGNRFPVVRSVSVAAAALALAVLCSCSVNVKKEPNGQDKQVDISTPMGGIHVSKGADAADTGLAVYPGARLKPEASEHGDKSANVSISGFGYGLKVVALQYESDDSPDKVIAFYKDQLKKYGSVLECPSSGHFNLNMKYSGDSGESRALACDGSRGATTELKVGTEESQHIVAVSSEGKGSSFALVYVRTHGKETDI
jgi:hypothetical protein